MRRHLLASPTVLAAVAALPVAADDEPDLDRARAAAESGQIRPLAGLLAEAERRHLGLVVEAELGGEDGNWTCEVKLLPPTGRMYRAVLNAATGAVVGTRGRVQERPR